MHNFSPPPSPTVTALSKEISLDYGRTVLALVTMCDDRSLFSLRLP